MENYFDIATEQEIAERFPTFSSCVPNCPASISSPTRFAASVHDMTCALLAGLWFGRGDTEKADHYLEQIKDERERLDTSISLYELREA